MKLRRALALIASALPVCAQYGGPAILSRGEVPFAMSAPEIHFRPFLEFTGIYDSGLAAVAVPNQGGIGNQSSPGVAITWGISGTHGWRHTTVGLDYRGSINQYASYSAYNSLNQSLLLGVTHQLAPHAMFSLHTTAGTFTRDFGLNGLPQTVPFDPATANIPTTDFFDNRTKYVSSMADLVLQESSRLSVDFGGGGYIVRRQSSALAGTTAANAHGDLQYRLSRHTTIGASYNYFRFDFTRIFGATDVHAVTGTFALQLTRLVEITGYAGFSRAESKFIQTVPIDPVIAALLGIREGTQVVHSIDFLPNVSVRLSRTFQRGVAYVSGGHTIVPGNGLFLTSYATTILGGYTYTGIRLWSFGAQVNYTGSRSIGNIIGAYTNISGTLSASRQLFRSVHLIASYSARQYDSPDFARYNRLVNEARIGLGWSPGEVPLRIW